MPPPDPHPAGFSQGRRWLTTLNLLLATAATLALVVMFNYLAAGHFKRFFWAEATNSKLSPSTLAVLKSLTNDVTATIFYEHRADVYTMVAALLAEYQQANPSHIRKVDLDYIRSPEEARNLRARLHLGPDPKNFVAFESNGHHQICPDSKLSDPNLNDLLEHRPIRRTAFRGEMYFTSAINFLSHPVDQKAYFLTGHGERDPTDQSQTDGSGCTNLAAILKDELVCDWSTLALTQTDSIPADCSLLIIATGGSQPKAYLSPHELAQIQTYLNHGNGRLLALLDNTEGLDRLLGEWDVLLANWHVIDRNPEVWSSGGDFLASPAVKKGSMHPIMSALFWENLRIRMLAPHPIFWRDKPVSDPGAPTLTAVAATGPMGIQLPGEQPVVTGTNGSPLPPQPYQLIAAVEHNVINGLGGTRVVVAGDSDFLDDQMIDSAANHYFASQTLNWLLQRPGALVPGIGPHPIKEYQIFMPQSQRTHLRWLFLAAMPGSVLFLGGLVWLRRRS